MLLLSKVQDCEAKNYDGDGEETVTNKKQAHYFMDEIPSIKGKVCLLFPNLVQKKQMNNL